MRKTCLLLNLLLIAMPATAQMYRSVDANGKVVYSDTPPADQNGTRATRIAPTGGGSAPAPRASGEGTKEKRQQSDNGEAQRMQLLAARAAADKACRTAQDVLKTAEFAEGRRLAARSANGDLHFVSDEERAAAIAAAQRTAAASCR